MMTIENKLARARDLYVELATKPERTTVDYCESMLEKRGVKSWSSRLDRSRQLLAAAKERCKEIFDHFIEIDEGESDVAENLRKSLVGQAVQLRKRQVSLAKQASQVQNELGEIVQGLSDTETAEYLNLTKELDENVD